MEVKGMVGFRENGFVNTWDGVHGSKKLRVFRSLATSKSCHMALQFQSRNRILGLSQQVRRQKPKCQRQLRRLENGAGRDSALVAASRALPDRTIFPLTGATLGAAATRTNEALGSACHHQRRMALRLRPVDSGIPLSASLVETALYLSP
uniref:Uncharacterized protein n=1 Tax=mine drainage metagenome TaxID=410659 RepID=E6QQ93_9ZZZZ